MFNQSIVLEFDKRLVSEEEMIENIDYYISRSNEGMKLISQGNQKGAMKILKEIKTSLKKEYMYYNKENIKPYIHRNNVYRTYQWGIILAYSKLYKVYSYKYLYDNLFNVWDSISNHDSCLFLGYRI
ncbi:hypothetical protein [Romboutsia sp. 1001713B170131_170501_G6]|uniref:hypothetical protein n=1 Tax=Romboutsia sp. 1001713B170131_170501_G6 TaxID=2787108 RepID=UPI0018AB8A99|nr:hypothetical protein [Romboutsia sp. 1001713B170131_170501_G6]